MGSTAIADREAVCSCAYLDVLLRLADIVWADLTYPGADVARAFAKMVPRVLQKMELLDGQLDATAWVAADGPVVADFFAGEAFEVFRYFLGPPRDTALRERLPRLAALARAVGERPRLANGKVSRPERFTGRADEDRVVARLHAVDLSSVGL